MEELSFQVVAANQYSRFSLLLGVCPCRSQNNQASAQEMVNLQGAPTITITEPDREDIYREIQGKTPMEEHGSKEYGAIKSKNE